MSEPTTTVDHERVVVEISGHVQAVGYRYYARKAAVRLNLVGWVRNDPEGTVTVWAEGPKEKLEAFVEILEEGPTSAEVDEVDVRWEPASGRFEKFSVEQY
ncbi:MAG: acylphosphatase [Rubricoccaceae bacterium]|nr:acylphosphatase [Rubricoccaceae bacterium]